AWHALGAVAMENGDLPRAVDCFEREAAASTSPADRMRLFDALGDLAHNVLHDPGRAERYWREVADGDAPILDKLLGLARDRGATVESAEICIKLAGLDAARSKELLQEAARAFAAGADFVRARAAAERLIQAHPIDVDAVDAASEVALAGCDADAAATWLHRALITWDKQKTRDPRHVELWQRLGDAERSRNRLNEARTAYQRAVGLDTKSAAALPAR